VSAWKTASLGEIFDIARGGSPRPIQDYITDDPDGVNWISISDASASDKFINETKKRIRPEGVSRSRMVKPGDFLLTNSMSFGRPYIMGTSGCIHDGWLVLSSKHGDVDQDYFFHLLGSDFIYAKFTKLAAGATVKNLNIDLVSGVEVNFPPLEEQRRIAAILDQAETLRTQRRQALAHLDSLTQSLFLDMFGDPARNTLGLPMQQLGDLGDWHSGGTPPRGSGHYFEGGIPWFSSGELESMYVSDSSEHISDRAIHETSAKLVPAGSLMLGMYDTAALKSSIAVNPCSCNQAIAFASILPDRALTVYVYFAVQVGREDFRRLQRGVRQKNLNLSMVREIRIPAPPLPLQQTFATRIQAIEALKATHRTALAQLDALFAALQQRAFAGEL